MPGFDLHEPPAILNFCLSYAKFYIFRYQVQKARQSFPVFLQYLKQQFHIEQLASFQYGNTATLNP